MTHTTELNIKNAGLNLRSSTAKRNRASRAIGENPSFLFSLSNRLIATMKTTPDKAVTAPIAITETI